MRRWLAADALRLLTAHSEDLYRPSPRPDQCRWLGCEQTPTDLDGPWCWQHRAWHYARARLRADMRKSSLRELANLARLGLIRGITQER